MANPASRATEPSFFMNLTMSILRSKNPSLTRSALKAAALRAYQATRETTPNMDDRRFEQMAQILAKAQGLTGNDLPPSSDEIELAFAAFFEEGLQGLSGARKKMFYSAAATIKTVRQDTDQKKKESSKCQACYKTAAKMMKCGRCYMVRYCGKKCQKRDWPRHKHAECVQLGDKE